MRIISLAICSLIAGSPAQGEPRRILFVGNSKTHGAFSEVKSYRPDLNHDLTGNRVGGVPALFAAMSRQAGLSYQVYSLTSGGQSLAFHLKTEGRALAQQWDVLVLQEHSAHINFNAEALTNYERDAGRITSVARRANPRVDTYLLATWSRADLTYSKPGFWRGKPVTAMGARADMLSRRIASKISARGVIPVGSAWNLAITQRVAKARPTDATAGGLSLWAKDQNHASKYGYYLEALVVFGSVTGKNPMSLGAAERSGAELKISPQAASSLQRIACEALRMSGC